MSATTARAPLAGLRVLDISNVIAGPFAAGMLGDFGAEVLKVELPGSGDPLRALRTDKRKTYPQGRQTADLEGHQPQQEGHHARLAQG